MKKLLLIILFFGASWMVYAQDGYTVILSGPTSVTPGYTYTYDIDWEWNFQPSNPPLGTGTYTWTVYGGTVHSSGASYAAIEWDGTSGAIIYEYTSAAGHYYYATLTVQ